MALSLTCKKFLRLPLRNIRLCSTSCQEKKGLVLGVYYDEDCDKLELTPAAETFNQQTGGKLLDQIQLAGNKVNAGKSFQFWGLDCAYPCVSVVGLGPKAPPHDVLELIDEAKENVRIAAAAGCKALAASGIKSIFVESLGDAETAAEGATLSTWKFQQFKTKPAPLPSVSFHDACGDDPAPWTRGSALAYAQNHARRLADTPANLLTPSIFAEQAQALLEPLKNVQVKVYDQAWAEQERMGAFLAVAKGSIEPPKFLELTYKNCDVAPFVLVGKGVTFDAGGISLKPGANMDEMRADMSGAACVLATIYALAALETPTHVKVLVPLVENMPSGTALKPGDVITARNGMTICVDNTDAEGRLILADALCYSATLKPKGVLDIATLTGAMRVAVGGAATGVFSNSNELYKRLERAGSVSGDRVWRFPLWKFYSKLLTENDGYDINNIGKPQGGGSCTAAAFLREFAPKGVDWAHLDIAGIMGPNDSTPYLTKGMTGRPTRTLIRFVEELGK